MRYHTVAHQDLAAQALGDVRVVGDDDQGILLLAIERQEQVHDLLGRVLSRLPVVVGQDHRGVADCGPGNRYTLALAAGQVGGAVMSARSARPTCSSMRSACSTDSWRDTPR